MLTVAPRIDTIVSAQINALPCFHPESGPSFAGFPVNVFLIHHPDGSILVDTGIGTNNAAINEWYQPTSMDQRAHLESAMNLCGSVDEVVE